MAQKLDDSVRAEHLAPLYEAGWELVAGRDAIKKSFVFGDFTEAFAFMTGTALWAEKWDHHPEWSNVYKTVEVTLTTHDVDGLSDLDIKLARKMDSLV